MAADKDNSNNYTDNNENLSNGGDTSGFDDEKELEKYGVWVKTGPEEIDDIEENTDFNLSDLEEESIITDEEEEMLGKLEKELSQNDSDITESITDLTDSIDDNGIDLNLEDLEEIGLDELSGDEDNVKIESDDDSPVESFDLDIDFDDDLSPLEEESITLDDDLSLESPTSISSVVDDIDLNMDILLDDTDEDLIDDLDVDLLLEEDSDELISDSDENPDNIESEIADTSEEDIELVDFVDELDEITELELEKEGIQDIDQKNETDLYTSVSELEEDFNETEKIIEDLTDLDDLEEPIFESSLESESNDSSDNIATNDVASEILRKIEQELLSIKSELHDVKKELSTLHPDSIAESISEKQFTSDDDSGFFREDEDETIALTGDELDNILNTADITEETGSESESPEELLQMDSSEGDSDEDKLLSDNEDIITIEDDIELEIVQEDEVVLEDLETEDLINGEIGVHDKEISPDLVEDLIEDEIIEFDDIDTDVLISDESKIISENIDPEPFKETIDDDIPVLEDLDAEELFENETDLIDENIELESLEEIPEENEIVLADLDTEVLTSDLIEGVDLSDDLEFDIDNVEEINKTNLEIESIEDEPLSVVASEPDATSTIDMELPEMQEVDEVSNDIEEEGLTELSPQLKTEIKSVLSYMDQLLESLPEEKIDEFANSEHYEVYKKLFEELGLN